MRGMRGEIRSPVGIIASPRPRLMDAGGAGQAEAVVATHDLDHAEIVGLIDATGGRGRNYNFIPPNLNPAVIDAEGKVQAIGSFRHIRDSKTALLVELDRDAFLGGNELPSQPDPFIAVTGVFLQSGRTFLPGRCVADGLLIFEDPLTRREKLF